MADSSELDRRIAGIAALDQRLRRDLYRLLTAADGWTTRDEAAAALDVPRSVVAFHLDKLADAGVLEVRFERTTGRSGPGAGRPSKLYRPRHEEVAASVPDRRYDLAGSLLASAVAESERSGAPVADCLSAAARAAGHAIGAGARDAATVAPDDDWRARIVELLARHGYQPEIDVADEIVLANCPFHRLAEEHRDLVCGMNLDFLDGVIDGLGRDEPVNARLDPAPGVCCVRVSAG